MKNIYTMDWIDICISEKLSLEDKIYLLNFLFEKTSIDSFLTGITALDGVDDSCFFWISSGFVFCIINCY